MRSKEKQELEIFTAFARVSPLSISLESIENRKPPEPDIVCELESGNRIYFELTKSTPKSIEHSNSQVVQLPQRIYDKLNKLDETKQKTIKKKYRDALIYIAFKYQLTDNKMTNSIDSILNFLAELEDYSVGEFYPENIANVRWITIARNYPTFTIDIESVGTYSESTMDRIREKFAKYSIKKQSLFQIFKKNPLELIVYDETNIPRLNDKWKEEFMCYCKKEIPKTFFRRVWIFSAFKNKVVAVYPELKEL